MADSSAKDAFSCWEGFDVTFDKQFAPTATTPPLAPSDMDRSSGTMPKPQESSEDSMGPPTPVDRDYMSLGQLWDTLREKKARQMAKEVPKVKSLEDGTREFDREVPYVVQQVRPPSSPSPTPEETYKPEITQKVKKRKSMYVFHFRVRCFVAGSLFTCLPALLSVNRMMAGWSQLPSIFLV
jgi:hypothetical protein